MLKSKKLTLGLTGGIAVYKSAQLVRRLVSDLGAEVEVIMTSAAQRFITPLIFETFTGKAVHKDLFEDQRVVGTRHIDLARDADQVVVVPATANIIAKTASGIADDLLSTVILTAGNKTSFVLAMNDDMYFNPITQENIRKLKELGYGIMEPIEGKLACDTVGKGHIPDEEEIIEFIDARVNGRDQWKGKRVLVTAGPTREFIDSVRFISNPSSGRMGYALAQEAANRGAEVTLISGPTMLKTPYGCKVLEVTSAREMYQHVMSLLPGIDLLFMAAAVEDIKPLQNVNGKIKKEQLKEAIPIIKNPDILQKAGENKHKGQVLVGFSVDVENFEENARKKLKAKGLDLIVANNPSEPGAAFDTETNRVTLFFRQGEKLELPLMSKRLLARKLCDLVQEKLME